MNVFLTFRRFRNSLPAIATLALVLATGCSSSEESESAAGPGGRRGRGGPGRGGGEAIPVRVVEVQREDISSYILKTTTLEANREVQILARTAGLLTRLRVEEGDRVRNGQILAELDPEQYQLAVQEAEVRHRNAQIKYERAARMQEENLISDEQHDAAKVEFETAATALERAKVNLEYATIRAPFSGVIARRHCELGMMCRGTELLFDMVDLTPILARIHVPEKELGKLSVGQRARVRVETQGTEEYSGTVRLISPIVEAASGTVKVTVELGDTQNRLRPGMFAEVFIITETHENAMVVPKKALLLESEEDMVFAFVDGQARRSPIETGFVDGDRVEVLAGLGVGDAVITIGHEGLRDGAAVRIPGEEPPAMAAGGERGRRGAGGAGAAGGEQAMAGRRGQRGEDDPAAASGRMGRRGRSGSGDQAAGGSGGGGAGGGMNPERIERLLANLLEQSEAIKAEHARRLREDPELGTDIGKKVQFVREMMQKMRSGEI